MKIVLQLKPEPTPYGGMRYMLPNGRGASSPPSDRKKPDPQQGELL